MSCLTAGIGVPGHLPGEKPSHSQSLLSRVKKQYSPVVTLNSLHAFPLKIVVIAFTLITSKMYIFFTILENCMETFIMMVKNNIFGALFLIS